MSDAFRLRVIAIALEAAENEAAELEHDTGREFVQFAIKRLREELRIYDKRAQKSRAA